MKVIIIKIQKSVTSITKVTYLKQFSNVIQIHFLNIVNQNNIQYRPFPRLVGLNNTFLSPKISGKCEFVLA